ncbi:uncharacterized protein K452DRAFT_289531 [Aplosporella prunicola CBS 121167]|uniref:Uncharacterized protein n=1 Tax=Aplosporella prunicola CBS 121167 TaxID=1176127 RepID=A0A6A6B691_9PEZI|nr:uncharacterized protein K452DRAFT_289531 [Aplosporella prunicola CBS 121167]KAF2139530.1 hypothetical protein K452DRAFT_289531 [Aplosporella prunicola CBS 121167]
MISSFILRHSCPATRHHPAFLTTHIPLLTPIAYHLHPYHTNLPLPPNKQPHTNPHRPQQQPHRRSRAHRAEPTRPQPHTPMSSVRTSPADHANARPVARAASSGCVELEPCLIRRLF